MVTEPTPQRALTSLVRAGCAQMFFIYPGRADVFRDRGTRFLAMVQSAGLGNRNLALVADPYGENYARGANADIPDLTSLLEWHRHRLREFTHVAEWYHLGNSSGGYGAMLFGHLLGANTVWAIAPRTARLGTADAAKARLKEMLVQGGGATKHVILYSLLNRRDCAFAEYFAGCPGVVLSPYTVPPPGPADGVDETAEELESWYHWGLMRTLMARGDLQRLMPPFVPATTSSANPRSGRF